MLLLAVAALAQEPPANKQQAQLAEIAIETENIANDVWLVKVYMRDEKLIAAGFAPEGWERPAFEVYESNLDGRPSMLPFVNFAAAVEAGVCSPEELELFSAGGETERLEDFAGDTD